MKPALGLRMLRSLRARLASGVALALAASFVSVPAHCAAGILIVLILAAMRHVALTAVGKPYAPPSYVRSKV